MQYPKNQISSTHMDARENNKNSNSFNKINKLVESVYKHISPETIPDQVSRVRGLLGDSNEILFSDVIDSQNQSVELVDLFCGAGGLSLGFELEGGISKLAIDFDPSAIETYLTNRPRNTHAICGDIREYLNDPANKIPKVPLLIGGPPCQGFSNANQQPKKNDPRNLLWGAFLEFASRAKTKLVVMENVPGILKSWKHIQADLNLRGFNAQYFELNACDFGAPQNRKRVFIVGIRHDAVASSENFFTHFKGELEARKLESKPAVLSDALFGLPSLAAKKIKNSTSYEDKECGFAIAEAIKKDNHFTKKINLGFKSNLLFNHRTKYNNPRDIKLFQLLNQGEDTSSPAFEKVNPYKSRAHIFKDKFFRLKESLPSKTVTAHMYYDCHMYIHPHDDRGLTPREAARVQGFPDQYVFVGKPNEWYRQIGNAVSPLVARALARSLLSTMKKFKVK